LIGVRAGPRRADLACGRLDGGLKGKRGGGWGEGFSLSLSPLSLLDRLLLGERKSKPFPNSSSSKRVLGRRTSRRTTA
jgi:hypothetical protein